MLEGMEHESFLIARYVPIPFRITRKTNTALGSLSDYKGMGTNQVPEFKPRHARAGGHPVLSQLAVRVAGFPPARK
jgi:hypothetical protein